MFELTGRFLDASQDLEVLQAVHDGAPGYYRTVFGRLPDGTEALETFQSLPPGLRAEAKAVLGFFLEGTLVGCAELLRGYPEPGIAFIGLLLFAEAHQGAGLGHAALERVAAVAADWHCDALRLTVVATNGRALAFWRREGFREHHRKPVPGATGDGIVMERGRAR
jgi:GNAT superfamily N-acetyltransferase